MRYLLAACAALLCACDGGRAISGLSGRDAPVAVAPDAAPAGPWAAADEDYDFGRISLRDEVTGDTHESDIHGYIRYPQDAPGPFPVLLFQHGRHQTCETGIGQAPVFVGDDNCPELSPVLAPAASYRGYDYLAQNLASHGYAVISIDTNDVNDNDSGAGSGDTGALARATLILAHLDAFREISRSGGQGFDHLAGRLDFSRVGIMGHSRGGEGVSRTVTLNAEQDEPHQLQAVFALAPTDYMSQAVAGVTYATLLPYCDGDVEDLMGSFAYDNARYAIAGDPAAKFQILAMGANHNYFNTVWTSDDWEIHGSPTDSHCGQQAPDHARDTPEGQRALGQFFIASFFRHFVGGEAAFGAYWRGDAAVPDSACPGGQAPCAARYHLSVHPGAERRLLIDATPNDGALARNALGGAVRFEGFSDYGSCRTNGRPGEGCAVAEPTFAAAAQLYLRWQTEAVYRSELNGLDARGFEALSLRVGVSHGDTANAGGQDFDIVLIDADGLSQALPAASLGPALFDPPGGAFDARGSEKTTLNALRAPLAAFDRIDLRRLQALELRFGRVPAGSLQITDIMLQRAD